MSRAPAPMKLETPNTNVNANPYAMGTFAAMPNTAVSPYSMGGTAAPMHAMQNMYTNMQQPQNPYGAPQPYIGQQAPAHPGMQNVSVLDFKPDVLAQQQAARIQQQYNSHMNAMTAASNPSLGLVGPDGRYLPATAATPRAMSPQFASNPYESVGASMSHNGAWGSHGLHSYEHTQSRNPYGNARNMSEMYNPRRSGPPSRMSEMYRGRGGPSSMSEMYRDRSPARPRSMHNMLNSQTPSPGAVKSMINAEVQKEVGLQVGQIAKNSTASPTIGTTNAFQEESKEKQREMVGAAVRNVLQHYKVESKYPGNRGMPHDTSSSYSHPSRARESSRFDSDGAY